MFNVTLALSLTFKTLTVPFVKVSASALTIPVKSIVSSSKVVLFRLNVEPEVISPEIVRVLAPPAIALLNCVTVVTVVKLFPSYTTFLWLSVRAYTGQATFIAYGVPSIVLFNLFPQ